MTKIFLILASQALAQKNLSYYDSLFGLAENYKNEQQYEKAIAIYDRIKNSGEWMDDLSNARKVFNNKGFVFYKTQNYDSSAANYLKSNQIALGLKDTAKIIGSYKSIAMAYRQMGLYAKSLENNQKALALAELIRDHENIIDIVNSKGLIYYNLKQFERSLSTHREALAISFSTDDSLGIAYMYNNLAMSHFQLGRYDSSLYYNHKALLLKESLGLPRADQVANLNNIGEDYLELDSLELAEKFLSEANQLYIERGNNRGQMICSTNLAKLAIKKQDYGTAQSYLDIVDRLFDKVYIKDLYLDYLELRTELLEKQGQHAEAIVYLKELSALKEDIFQEEKLNVQQVESSYLLREKELERANAAQEAELAKASSKRNAQFIVFLLIGLLLAGIVAVVFVRLNRRLKDSNRIIQAQKLDLKHSTYNTLMRIQALLRLTTDSIGDPASKEKLQQVEAAIISAAALQQFTYNVENEDEVSLGQFLEELVERLKEAFSSSGHAGISYSVEIRKDTLLPVKTVFSCGLMVGEIVNNSVKYAFVDVPSPKININLGRFGPHLLLQVGDNGVGMAAGQKSNGIGTGLVFKLAKYIRAELTVRNEGGTWYTIRLKV